MRRRSICFCMVLLCTVFFFSCSSERRLPEGGYDYRAVSSVLLGYPIPEKGENSYTITEKDVPAAWKYDEVRDRYTELPVKTETLSMPDGTEITAHFAPDGETNVWFSAKDKNGWVLHEGETDGRAVITAGNTLLAADEIGYTVLTEYLCTFFDFWEECLLYSAESSVGEVLFLYKNGEQIPLYTAEHFENAWMFAQHGKTQILFETERGWFAAGDEILPCAEPVVPTDTPDAFTHPIPGTGYYMTGDSGSLHLYAFCTGEMLPVDMGGITEIPPGEGSCPLLLSPSRKTVFLWDFDTLYALDLTAGDFTLAPNEAPTFENTCILSSVTAVGDDRLLLSQAAAEHTEYTAVITEGVFVPETLTDEHYHDKIDVDSWVDSENTEE